MCEARGTQPMAFRTEQTDPLYLADRQRTPLQLAQLLRYGQTTQLSWDREQLPAQAFSLLKTFHLGPESVQNLPHAEGRLEATNLFYVSSAAPETTMRLA